VSCASSTAMPLTRIEAVVNIASGLACVIVRTFARSFWGWMEVLEGKWIPKRLVILEYPSVPTLKAWYDSPEYQRLLDLRNRTAISDFVVLEGV
jgi:hypothetical protein